MSGGDERPVGDGSELAQSAREAAEMLTELAGMLRESGDWAEDYLAMTESRANRVIAALAPAQKDVPGDD